jgi:hypothetical protein
MRVTLFDYYVRTAFEFEVDEDSSLSCLIPRLPTIASAMVIIEGCEGVWHARSVPNYIEFTRGWGKKLKCI